MTTDELFAQMEAEAASEKVYCIIDPETREISVPTEYQILGVESDEKVERIYFKCPKIVGDNIDLSKLGIRVNYENANKQRTTYPVDDVKVEGENITFSWLLDRPVTQYKGTVHFVVCAIKTSGDEITNEWNTTLAQSEVLEGLEPDLNFTEEEESLVELLVAQCTQKLTEMSVSLQKSEKATQNANASAQEAKNATEDARSVTDQITKDSYLHTALQSFINEVTATPTAYGNALVEKIEGYIRQNQPKGYQMFDASKLASKTYAGATVTNNGDGSFTVSGSGTLIDDFSISYTYLKDESLQIISTPGVYKLSGKYNVNSFPAVMWGLYKSGSPVNGKRLYGGNVSSIEITDEDIQKLATEEYRLTAYIFGSNGSKIIPGTIKPMIYVNGDGTWEPFTGGEPAPSPDYSQTIHGVGDMGFFDGEFADGGYNSTTGDQNLNVNYIRSVNDIYYPLKLGDKIKFIYEKPVNFSILLYDSNGDITFKSSSKVSEWEYSVEKEQERFKFYINDSDGTTAMSAKHLTVTINGMYAVCVKSIAKNLIDFDKYYSKYRSNDGYSGANNTVNGIRITIPKNLIGKQLTFSASLKKSSELNTVYVMAKVSGVSKSGNTVTDYNSYKISKVTFTPETYSDTIFLSYDTGLGTTYFKNLQLEIGETSTDYVPYQGNTTYIPISSPLFEGDQIVKRNGEYKLRRKWGMAAFDGSADEQWASYNNTTYKGFSIPINITGSKSYQNGYCNIFKVDLGGITDSGVWIDEQNKRAYAHNVNPKYAEDIAGWKTWLQSHNMIVIYPLSEPTEEELTPEAQKAIHSIMACDELTTLEIVGVPEDVEIQNQFLLPRNVDGALNTMAYATAKRNEVTLAEQKANTETRLQAIEAQILQEV